MSSSCKEGTGYPSARRRFPLLASLDTQEATVALLTGNSEGIETHPVDGIEVPICAPAKTVADCFKFRNKIGPDVALQALRSGLEEQRFRPAELMKFARVCRVRDIVRPYLEILV